MIGVQAKIFSVLVCTGFFLCNTLNILSSSLSKQTLHVLKHPELVRSTISSALSQRGLTGYCKKFIDRLFCLRTDDMETGMSSSSYIHF